MINKLSKIFIQNEILLVLAIIMCFFTPYKTDAATLSISPSSSNVSVGNIITVKVYVNTLGKSINNGEATIQFPTDMLDVISVTKNSSIFSLWVEEPSFSNNTGIITFNGGIPNPGWTGSRGYITSITFKAKKQGVASILLSDGAVRENDGLGTNILTAKSGSTISIISSSKEEIKVPVKDTDKSTILKNEFTPSIRFEGNQGIINLSNKKIITNIDYFTLSIDNTSTFKINKEQLINYEYYLPIQREGSHSINIVSFENTGKYTESVLTYISPAISIPVISLNTYEITANDSVIIRGKTNYPNSKVNVILELNNKEIEKYTQTTGIDGSFSITTDKIKEVGLINIWAESVLLDTVKSIPSEKVYLKVNETAVIKITVAIFYPLLWLIIIFTIISLLFVLLYLGWHKFFGLKKMFENKSKQTAIEVHKAMILLKDELNSQLKSLEKIKKDRNLNEKEEAIFNEIEKNIDGVDTFIEKKLKKIL
jgi:hypothetical protein